MKLLDDKYQIAYFSFTCKCGKDNCYTAPPIKGLITVQQCGECGRTSFVEDDLASTTQGLHPATIKLYNAVTKETASGAGRMTLRHLFYRLVSKGVLEKTEKQYNKLIKDVGNMRKTGIISYDFFADGTRWQRKPRTYSGVKQALERTARFYRKDYWENLPVYVEFWVEKDAISDIVFEVTEEFDVPLMVARGFASLSFLHSSAEYITETGKKAFIYHLGDYDPSGLMAAKTIENSLRGFGADIEFRRLAVTTEQIQEFNLPTRPTKESNHSKNFNGDSVEIDAMDPQLIQALVRDAIFSHVDHDQFQKLKSVERAEKESLLEYCKNFGG